MVNSQVSRADDKYASSCLLFLFSELGNLSAHRPEAEARREREGKTVIRLWGEAD